jgi:zinc transporter, ZIP family
MLEGNILFAFGLTVFAGMSTVIGSLMAFYSKKFNPAFLCGSLGFSAGVMIYVSFVEIFVKANESLSGFYGDETGNFITVIAFFSGIALIAIIDRLVPNHENPHELNRVASPETTLSQNNEKLRRMGLFSALAIAIHNFPEGLATFMGALHDPAVGISIAVAIAIHNIPEGIAVSVPIYFATKSKRKAFWLSFLSGLAEPMGALIGYFLLINYFSDSMFGIIFAGVAGIMVYVSLDELLPAAHEFGKHHIAIGGLVGGMMVMAASLLLLA